MRIAAMTLVLCTLASSVAAQKYASASAYEGTDAASKFDLQGGTLIYNSDNATGDAYPEIDNDDVDVLRSILRENSNISTLQLTSGGGFISAGKDMARIVQDYGLDTRVEEECNSSCVTIFLAGMRRTLTPGSRIGFHQTSWNAEGTQGYYKDWRETSGWRTPFDFAAWLYQDTQHETATELAYMLSRGVDPDFAIETKMHRPVMWFPTRAELVAAGVLRD